MRLGERGCSIEKRTRDARTIEVYCSWRQVHATESEDAWLFNVGMVNPFLVVKRWIETDEDRHILEAFVRDLTSWRSAQPPIVDFRSIPVEASESFPDYQSGATKLDVSSTAERRARKSVASALRRELPDYRVRPSSWVRPLGYCILGIVTVAALGFVATFQWSDLTSHWGKLLLIGLHLLLICVFGVRILLATSREIRVQGALSDKDLWYDYRAVLLRMPLDSFPFRRLVGRNIVLATPTGTTTIVLSSEHFESEESFDRAANRLIAPLGTEADADGIL